MAANFTPLFYPLSLLKSYKISPLISQGEYRRKLFDKQQKGFAISQIKYSLEFFRISPLISLKILKNEDSRFLPLISRTKYPEKFYSG